MPWTVADVDKHNKGLSPIQKKKWVQVANSSLRSCIAEGGSDNSCAPKAIQAANAAVKNFQVALFLDGPLVNIRRMEIFKTGKWNGHTFEEKDILEMEQNFKNLEGDLRPKLKITHRDEQETLAGLSSYGDVISIYTDRVGGRLKLFADVDDVPLKVAEWIRDGRFKERSIELLWRYVVDDKEYKKVITAVALLGHEIPAVAGMEPIKLQKEDNELNTKELVGVAFTLDENEEGFSIEENEFARGDGRGQGGPRQGDGGAEICKCPKCGYETTHEKGKPCNETICAKCGATMIGKNMKGGEGMDLKEILSKIEALESQIASFVKAQKDKEDALTQAKEAEAKKKLEHEIAGYKKQAEELTKLKEDYTKMKETFEKAQKEKDDLIQKNKETEAKSFINDLKGQGKLVPAFEKEAFSLLTRLDSETKVGKFSIVDDKGKEAEAELSQFEVFQNLLKKLPKIVDFKESSKKGEGDNKVEHAKEVEVQGATFQLSDTELEKEAQEYMKENKCTYEDAIVAVSAKFKKQDKEQGLDAIDE